MPSRTIASFSPTCCSVARAKSFEPSDVRKKPTAGLPLESDDFAGCFQVFSGNHGNFADDQIFQLALITTVFAVRQDFIPVGNLSAAGLHRGFNAAERIGLILLYQAKLQLGGVFDQALHTVGIIDSRQLDDDLILDLLPAPSVNLQDGFRYTQSVHAPPDGLQRLPHGRFPRIAHIAAGQDPG